MSSTIYIDGIGLGSSLDELLEWRCWVFAALSQQSWGMWHYWDMGHWVGPCMWIQPVDWANTAHWSKSIGPQMISHLKASFLDISLWCTSSVPSLPLLHLPRPYPMIPSIGFLNLDADASAFKYLNASASNKIQHLCSENDGCACRLFARSHCSNNNATFRARLWIRDPFSPPLSLCRVLLMDRDVKWSFLIN